MSGKRNIQIQALCLPGATHFPEEAENPIKTVLELTVLAGPLASVPTNKTLSYTFDNTIQDRLIIDGLLWLGGRNKKAP